MADAEAFPSDPVAYASASERDITSDVLTATASRSGSLSWIGWLAIAAVVATHMVVAWQVLAISMSPSLYPDSGTALSISRRLAGGDVGPLWHTQSPLLQDGYYALLIRLNQPDMFGLAIAWSTVGLTAVLGWVLYRASGITAAAGIPAVVMMYSVALWDQAGNLTFYAPFLLLGYGGAALCVPYVVKGGHPLLAVAGAALIALSLHAYTTALVFIAVPAMAMACWPSRASLKRGLTLYAVLALLSAPWFAWHLSVGGPTQIHYHPLNWFTEKYLATVNDQFWQYPQQSPIEYVRVMGRVGLRDIIPWYFIPLGFLGLAAVTKRFGARAAAFCVACVSLYIALLVVTQPSPFARYYLPIVPLVILLVSGAIVAGVNAIISHAHIVRKDAQRPAVEALLLLLMFGMATATMLGFAPSAIEDARVRYVDRLDTSTGFSEMRQIATIVHDGKGDVIARDSSIQALIADRQVYTHYLLSEADYVAFLTWQSDASAISVLDDHGIEFVLLRNDVRWERDYHVWLTDAYQRQPQHYLRIAESPRFERVYTGDIYTLYRLNSEATPR